MGFQFGKDGLLHSLAGGCIISSDGALRIGSCETASQADDGRAMFDLTTSGQIRIGVGDLCVVASGHVLATATCVEASKSSSAADKFFAVAVKFAELASTVTGAGQTASSAADRLTGTIGDLH